MMTIPNIIDSTVPIGKDDSENVEVQRYGEPVVPDFEIPYHTAIMETFDGIDMESAGRVAGNAPGVPGRAGRNFAAPAPHGANDSSDPSVPIGRKRLSHRRKIR